VAGGAYLGEVMLKDMDVQSFQENFDISEYRKNIAKAIRPRNK